MGSRKIVSDKKLLKYHKHFDLVKRNRFLRLLMFSRMSYNRFVQSSYIIFKNPNIWRFLIKGFFRASLGKRTLRSLEIAVTYNCNSKCAQCSCRLAYDPKKEKTSKLTLEETKDVIDQAVDMGAFQFALNGGEPLLEEEKVLELTKYIKKKYKGYVHLCTNGYLLTDDKILKLKKAGLDSIEMGFDSAFKSKHDFNRLKGSYNKIFENIELCKKYKINVVLNTILINEKVKSDDIIYTFYLAKKFGCMLQITPCCLTGAFKNKLDVMLTDETNLYFYWLLSRSWRNRSDLYSSLTKIKCPAGREKIGIQPYGDVVSCPLIQISYGNIRDKSLKQIQDLMLENPYYSLKKSQGCLPSMSKNFINEYLLEKK